MASYSTVKSGSKGSSVSELQTLLNDKGYDLSVDGIFGSKTQAAVRDYQSKNGLSVDGIVGKNTWNALTGGSSGASSGSSSAVAASPSPAGSAGYMQQLQEMMNQVTSGSTYKPGEFENPYGDKLLELTTPKTDEEYRQQATNQYMPQYNAQVEAAQQAAEREQLGYQNQLAQLERAMADSRESLNTSNQKNLSELQNSMLRRGVARSSYAAQTLANAQASGQNALSKLERDYLANTAYVGQQQQLTTSQLAQTEKRLKEDLATNIANYEQTLRSNDKTAQLTAYQQMADAYNAWKQTTEQLTAQAAQFTTSTQSDILQFLANMAQNQEQFDEQMAFNREQAAKAASAASYSRSSGGGGGGGGDRNPVKGSPITEKKWSDFSKAISTSTGKKNTINAYAGPNGNIFQAAAEYALEQQRRTGLYGY